ncbi:hypothetical protein APHAL10511_007435 [Amanita phalloides]|nr:hypothetical protein APHAL10511_007435 [Amanita phalloides]
MNNPQHYQPLGHALHPPSTSSASYIPSPIYKSKGNHNQNREEEEEDDDDDPDDVIVEDRHKPDGQGSNPSPPPGSSNGNTQNAQGIRPDPPNEPTQEPERKRRPGRPRGSKNRKPRAVSQGTTRHDTHLYQPTGVQHLAVPQHSADHNTQSQQFVEFQWRILNLCAEFYGAAEELVKSTSPLVLSQCYQLGPGSSNDPIKMLTDAKTVCDNLLANPSRLAMNPPTSTYHHQAPPAPPPTSAQSNSNPSTSTSKPTTPMITNPQSFVVSLGAQTAYPHAQYPMFTAGTTPYPTTYYQYSYPPPATAFYSQQPIMAAQPQPQPQLQTQSPGSTSQPATGTLSNITSTGLLNQGAWSDEETEKLKKLAEEGRTFNPTGEIDWDWVVTQYGNSRTRHQILIKATALGLKESSSRGVKRRRETEDDAGPSSNVNPASASPAQSNATSTPMDSPALQHQQRPSASRASLSSSSSNLPWPMPTVAVNTPSPVITTPTIGQDQQRTSYYRPRPAQDAGNPLTHNYMYNGTGSRLNKENGK